MLIVYYSLFISCPLRAKMGRPDTRKTTFRPTRRAPRHAHWAPCAPGRAGLGDGDTSMGHSTANAAASALRLLNSPDLRQHAARGPQERPTRASTPNTPVNLALLDYLQAHKHEVIDHARAVAPDCEPLPLDDNQIYDWYLRNTIGAVGADRRHRKYLLARHALEHAIRLGETNVVRKHPCPECGGWGLFWDDLGKRARCSDVDCRTPDGMAFSFTLARLAAQEAQETEMWRRSAT